MNSEQAFQEREKHEIKQIFQTDNPQYFTLIQCLQMQIKLLSSSEFKINMQHNLHNTEKSQGSSMILSVDIAPIHLFFNCIK